MKRLLAIALVCAIALTTPLFAQETKPAEALKPSGATAPSSEEPKEVKLQEVDGLKLQNLILTLNNLATQLQLVQSEFNRINEDKLPALIQALHDAYKLPRQDWAFDLKTLTFLRKPKEKVEPSSAPGGKQ